MARFNIVLLPAKILKDGRHKIRIAVSHHGTTRYLPTNYFVDSLEEFDMARGRVVNRGDATYMNKRLSMKLIEMQEHFDNLSDPDMYTCAQLLQILKRKDERAHSTFDMAYDQYMSVTMRTPKPSTVKLYGLARKWIRSQYDEKDFDLASVTPADIADLDRSMRRKGLSHATIKTYMSLIKAVLDFAVKMKLVDYEIDPFQFYTMPSYDARDLWFSVDEVRHIRDAELTDYSMAMVRDIWMLIFYLGGINIGDLLSFNFKGKKKMSFRRKKTTDSKKDNASTVFDIQPEAQAIIDKYMARSGKLHFGDHRTAMAIVQLFNRNKEDMKEALGLGKDFIMTSARKTFAQIGYDHGISADTIDYCLGHAPSKRMAMQYIKIKPEVASAAMRSIFDSLL